MRRLSRAARSPIGRKPGRWLKADLVDRSAAEAIHERQLRLWYQPVIRIMDHYLYGIEALARWSHPRRGLLTPGQFLPALRQAGHLRALDEWALTQACSDFRELRQNLGDRSPPFLAVNLSADTVCTKFHHLVEKVLDDTGVAASQLVLELSEDIELDELTAATPRLEHLRTLGVRLMLDDMGAGATGLRHLLINSLDGLKIDAALITGMLRNHRQHAVVKHLADLARGLSLPVIAEGVETADEVAALAKLEVEYAQGFHLGRPQPVSSLSARFGNPPCT